MPFTKNIAEIKSARLPILFSAAILLTTSDCGKNATQHMGKESSKYLDHKVGTQYMRKKPPKYLDLDYDDNVKIIRTFIWHSKEKDLQKEGEICNRIKFIPVQTLNCWLRVAVKKNYLNMFMTLLDSNLCDINQEDEA